MKATGTPEELAERLEMSKRNLFEILNVMRAIGGPITYNPSRNSYQYDYDCRLYLEYFTGSTIKGGKYINLMENFMQCNNLALPRTNFTIY